MQAVEKCHHVFRAVGQFSTVAGITAGLELNIFRVHITFDRGEMADDIGKTEFAFSIAPVKFSGGMQAMTFNVRWRTFSQ